MLKIATFPHPERQKADDTKAASQQNDKFTNLQHT
jgi:hypothetical protein